MNLIPGKFYRVQYTNYFGTKEDQVAEYCGIEDGEFAHCEECAICGKEGHARIHQFNYAQGNTVDEMRKQMNQCIYQTFYIGTSCIKKCVIEEVEE